MENDLSEEEVQKGLKAVIKDGLTSQAMITLTGGVFLVAFALKLGASNKVIGLLAGIPPLMQLIQLPSIYLVEKYRKRRTICIYASLLSRVFWLLIAFIPFIVSPEIGLIILIISLLLHTALAAISNTSWNSWMHDLIPHEQLGTFFSKRMSLTTSVGVVLYLIAGYFIDFWKGVFPEYELYAYSLLFSLGFIFGIMGVYFISTIPEPRMYINRKIDLLMPFKDRNFKNLMVFLASWNFAVNLAAPFFTVYMIKRLNLGISLIISLTVLSQIVNVLFFGIWGKLSDKFSNKSVLSVSGPLFMTCIFMWTFTTLPEKYVLTFPLLVVIHILMGISMAGVTLASRNISIKLAPKGQSTSYLAVSSIVNSIAAGIAPIIGGHFADFFAGYEFSMLIRWKSPNGEVIFHTLDFQQWDFFFFFAFLIGLYSIYRLSMVKEAGDVGEKVIIHELIYEMRNLSSVGGLRRMIQFPFLMMECLKRKR
ncbi:MAG: MFS transporter [Thermoplasmata archaeon]|nr:MAG: MFS transporter [Thermoplasmata archaeon]